jgi:glyoxylase-like metal-dependent hydrolase (beta-lactamase superfamily II)
MSMSGFASTQDLAEKHVSFVELADGLFAYTAEGDPNSGILVGPDGAVVVDAQATPAMAQDVIARTARVTEVPIRDVVLTHYHAVRVLGASGYAPRAILASEATRGLIAERGAEDMASEIGRFPRLFRGRESIPGLTWPSVTFAQRASLWLGKREAQLIHIGRAHTAGDTIAWCPDARVLFAGDTVEFGATPYCGDAHLADWPGVIARLRELKPLRMVPGRGAALMTEGDCAEALAGTEAFVTDLLARARHGVARGWSLREVYDDCNEAMRPRYGHWVIFEHCMPFNVSRAYDEASGIAHPRIWTDARDVAMWRALEGEKPVKSAEVR